MFSFHRLAENLRAKFRNCNLSGPESRSREHAWKVCDVKDWSGVEVDSAFGVAHPVVEVVDVCKDIPMCYHHAFWLPGRAACVDKPQNGVGVIEGLLNKTAANWNGFLVDYLLPIRLGSGDSEGGMANDPTRTRIFEHPVDLFGRQPGIQRNGDHAEHAAGIYKFNVVGSVRQQ